MENKRVVFRFGGRGPNVYIKIKANDLCILGIKANDLCILGFVFVNSIRRGSRYLNFYKWAGYEGSLPMNAWDERAYE